MKGLTRMLCPTQTEKNAQDCLKITRRHLWWANKRLESGCTDIEPQEIPWRQGFPCDAWLQSSSFGGLQHKHCRAHVIAGVCVKYRMPGTKERKAISASHFLSSTVEHEVVRRISCHCCQHITHQITIHASTYLPSAQSSICQCKCCI